MVRHPVFDALNSFLHPRPRERPLSPDDRQFLQRFEQIVEQQACKHEFTTVAAAEMMGLSRMHLNRRLRVLTGQTTHDHILARRLEVACALLTQGLSVRFVARAVGFNSGPHFARAFRKRYGIIPSAIRAIRSAPPRRKEDRG